MNIIPAAALVLVASTTASAQTQTFAQTIDTMTVTTGAGSAGADIQFMAPPIAFDIETVTGQPYSAEAVTEVVQTLPDGNRIVRRSKAEISRDGMGRTRREQGLAMLGPVVNGPAEFRQVQITDPQSGTIILLDPQRHTAHTLPAPSLDPQSGNRMFRTFVKATAAKAVESSLFEMAIPAPPALTPPSAEAGMVMFGVLNGGSQAAPVVEQLGKQAFDGVEADGTRTTVTIPAGQIGNEQPIKVVSERWYSEDLKVLLKSVHSDPRFGETLYTLTNITRSEPSPSSFEIPADYTVDK